ncbi:MAG: flagellar basal body P-ring formation chaperone FlgA [Bryobacterales bacterium]
MLTAITLLFSTQLAGCLPISSDVIVAADLAKAAPAFAAAPADTRIGYAPAPGATRTFKMPDLEREARRLDIELGEAREVCFQWPLSVPTEERFLEAMEKALEVPEARIEILETSRYPAPPGPLTFSRLSLQPPSGDATPVTWRGHVEYGQNRRFQVWARVRITASLNRVVTAEPIRAGEAIRAEQVRLEHFEGFPFGDPSASELDQVVGQILVRPLTSGMAIPAHLVERPFDVERADLVKVRVRNGSAVILAEGEAESGGRRGDTISIRNLASGAKFNAKITGPKQVTLTLSGK